MKTIHYLFCFCGLLTLLACSEPKSNGGLTIIKGAALFTGKEGDSLQTGMVLAIQADTVAGIFPARDPLPPDATVIDYSGKVIIPSLINGHGHLGLLLGDSAVSTNYSRDNIIRQLNKYASFGVGRVLSLGTDHELIFSLRDSSQKGLVPGATIYTAGFGIAASGGGPAAGFADKVMHPQTVAEAVKEVQQLAELHPDFVKVWVDDFGHTAPKMQDSIYAAVIKEAHAHHLRVAAHVFYLDDAKKLVAAGIDVLAHSVRDKPVDDTLINAMKEKGVFYIPTLTLDVYNFAYAGTPAWMNDTLFKRSLEPGVWERLNSAAFKEKQQKDSTLPKKKAAYETAVANLRRLDSAGIVIVLGTDSGAQPVRTQGFSEHLELQLMTEAGLTPKKALAAATTHAAQMLQVQHLCGTLETGKKADFMVLNGNPLNTIQATRSIAFVWKNGKVLQ